MRLIKILLVVVLALVVVAGALVWTAPAQLAYRWFAPRLQPFSLNGITGSVWQGSARDLIAMGVTLGPIDWRFDRGAALAGRVEGGIALKGEQVRGNANVRETGAGVIEIQQARLRFPATLLGPAVDIPALRFLGTIDIDAPRAEVRDGLLVSATGRARWTEIGVVGAAQARLPGIVMDFAPTTDGALAANITDLGGPLEIKGQTLLRDGHFLTEVRLHLREPNSQLEELLKFVGQRLPDGGSYLRVEGDMTPLSR